MAERPVAPKLLPERTLLYLRIADMPALRESFSQTATGRMAQDPQLKPLLGQLWQSAVDAFRQAEERLGVSLNDLLKIPQGEVCLALVAPEQGPPQLIAWLDCGDQFPSMQKLLDLGHQALEARGGTRTSEVLGDVELFQYEEERRRSRRTALFVKDNTVVLSSNPDLAKQLLTIWRGEQAEGTLTLADNRKFTSIMSRSLGGQGEQPQVSWYADPIEFMRVAVRGNTSGQLSLAILQGLGLDGFQAVGGSLLFASGEFDGIFHTHVLLDTPRTGVLDALALKSGDVTPEPWVPVDAASYTTWNWDVPRTYHEIVRIFEQFRGGEGVWKAQVLDRILEQSGIDLERDLIQATSGRFTFVVWMEKPARINSQSRLLAIKMQDSAACQQVIDRLAAKFPERLVKQSYGGVTYYQGQPSGDRGDVNPEIVRIQDGCIAVMDDYLILADSSKLLQQAIATKSDPTRSLANELDYKIIASRIQRQLGDVRAGMISFHRPEEAMRQVYEMAISETMRGALKRRADKNRLFKSLDDALTANPLPPFAVLAQYLAPGGALLTSDETGFHYMAFTLRRER